MRTFGRLVFLHCSKTASVTSRTAVYGPVRTVVWQGSAGDCRPYADQVGKRLQIQSTWTYNRLIGQVIASNRLVTALLMSTLSPRYASSPVCPEFSIFSAITK